MASFSLKYAVILVKLREVSNKVCLAFWRSTNSFFPLFFIGALLSRILIYFLPSKILDFFTWGCGIFTLTGVAESSLCLAGSTSLGTPSIIFSSFGSRVRIFGFGIEGMFSASQITWKNAIYFFFYCNLWFTNKIKGRNFYLGQFLSFNLYLLIWMGITCWIIHLRN